MYCSFISRVTHTLVRMGSLRPLSHAQMLDITLVILAMPIEVRHRLHHPDA